MATTTLFTKCESTKLGHTQKWPCNYLLGIYGVKHIHASVWNLFSIYYHAGHFCSCAPSSIWKAFRNFTFFEGVSSVEIKLDIKVSCSHWEDSNQLWFCWQVKLYFLTNISIILDTGAGHSVHCWFRRLTLIPKLTKTTHHEWKNKRMTTQKYLLLFKSEYVVLECSLSTWQEWKPILSNTIRRSFICCLHKENNWLTFSIMSFLRLMEQTSHAAYAHGSTCLVRTPNKPLHEWGQGPWLVNCETLSW